MGFIYYTVKSFCQGVLSIYFRKVYVIGAENIPKDGPVIICGNHSNQFIDPMMIISNCDREISFTMAASSYAKPVIGPLAKMIKVIPVHRAEDQKKKGTGQVKFTSSIEIKGINTKFLEESKLLLSNGISGLVVKNRTFLLDKVIDDETILVKESLEDYEHVKNGEFDYFYLPKIDNSVLFNKVYQRMSEDGCICIFPEGTSHDRTHFIKLKAGIALMTLGAMSSSEYNCKNVKIVPVGLNYYKREEFRSEVVIEFGRPFEVPKEWADEFKVDKRGATEKLLNEIEARMKSVTLTAPSYQELRSIFLVRKLYIPPDTNLNPTQYNELCKRFSKGYEKLIEREDTQLMMKKVQRYINELESTGVTDSEVKLLNFNYFYIVRKVLTSFILFHVYLIWCLPAIFILSPFAYLVKKKAEKERLAAKAKNPNKLEALDVVSSVKITYSILYMPFIFLIWCIFFYFYFNIYLNNIFYDFGLFQILIIASLIFPIYIYTSARMLDAIFFYLQTMLSRFLYFVYPKNIAKLKSARETLASEILKYVDLHINELDPKYAEERILYRKDTEQKFSDKEALIRRNSMRKSKHYIRKELDNVLSLNRIEKSEE